MKVIVDTDVWLEAIRKRAVKPSVYVAELQHLVEERSVVMLGIIRMEILCGIREKSFFKKVQTRLDAFPDFKMEKETFIMAAQFYNLCRSKGIQGSNNDFLICATSVINKLSILTKDKDFSRYQKFIPIELHQARTL